MRSYKFKGSVPQDYPHFRCQPQMGSPGGQHFCLTDYKFRGSHDTSPPSFDNLLEQFIEIHKALYLLLQFIIKDKNEQPDEEVHRARSERLPRKGAS